MTFDPEIAAFISVSERYNAPAGADMAQIREGYAGLCAHYDAGHPAGVAIRDFTLAGCPARRYQTAAAVGRVLYLHGGGFYVGGIASHDSICAEIAERTNCSLIALEYRLAPEHIHPAAFEDSLKATLELSEDGPLILAGDSAGGTLAAAIAVHLRETSRIAAQVLIYPALGGRALDLPSYTEKANAPLLSTADIEACYQLYGAPVDDPTATPLIAADFLNVAPAFISSAEEDPLRDDGPVYAERLREAGVVAEVVVEPGLPHGWLRARHDSARARDAFTAVCDGVSGFVDAQVQA